MTSPSRAVDGVVSRSTSTSSLSTRPMTFVSIWMPRAAASAASRWPRPVVSLPSEIRTIRFWAASGNSAVASRSAAPTSVAAFSGRAAQPVDLAELLGQALDERVLAERDDARLVALGHHLERLAQEREGVLAAVRADAVGQVDDEHGREPVDGQDELEARRARGRARRGASCGARAPRGAASRPCAAAPRGAARTSGAAPGSGAAARSAARSGCPSAAPPGDGARGPVAAGAATEAAPQARDARRGGRRATRRAARARTIRTIATQSSSRAPGRCSRRRRPERRTRPEPRRPPASGHGRCRASGRARRRRPGGRAR